MRYAALLHALEPDRLYAVATIVEQAVETGLLTRAPFDGDPLVIARRKARDALRKLRKHIPHAPEGKLEIRPGIEAPAWRGRHWQGILDQRTGDDDARETARTPVVRPWFSLRERGSRVQAVILVAVAGIFIYDNVVTMVRKTRLHQNRARIQAVLEVGAIERIAPDQRADKLKRVFLEAETGREAATDAQWLAGMIALRNEEKTEPSRLVSLQSARSAMP